MAPIGIRHTERSPVSALPPATGSTNLNVGTTERVVSALGGAALAVIGLRNFPKPGGIGLLLSGGYLLLRGISGYCAINAAIGRNTAHRKASAMEIRSTLTVNKPRSEVYAFWRRFENLPRFMRHLTDVKEESNGRSLWKAEIPGGLGSVSWKAEILEDRPDEFLAWRSLPGSMIDNAGEIQFRDAPGNRGTELKVCLSYRLPAGDVGTMAGKLFNPAIEHMMKEDLRRFKSLMETGEIPRIEGQPSGRISEREKAQRMKQRPDVTPAYESPLLERH